MISKLQISGVHTKLTPELKAYAEKKIGELDRYLSQEAKQSAQAAIKLKEAKSKDKLRFECEVIMKLPKATLTAHKKSESLTAAIDETEDNLKNQLKHYKNTHNPSKLQRHVISRLKRRTQLDV
jgi:ribosomal subunit interface protein